MHRFIEPSFRQLLLNRAAQIASDPGSPIRPFLLEVADSLQIKYAPPEFQIHWCSHGEEQILSWSVDQFSFYVAGDSPQALRKRDTNGKIRQKNWERAEAVLRKMAIQSGFHWSLQSVTQGAKLDCVSAPQRPLIQRWIVICIPLFLSLLVGGVGFLKGDWKEAVLLGLLTFTILRMAQVWGNGHLRIPPANWERVMIAAGVALTPFIVKDPLTVSFLAMIVLFAAVAHADHLEMLGFKCSPWAWASNGVLTGTPFLFAVTAGAALQVIMISVLGALLPGRMTRSQLLLFFSGLLAGLLLSWNLFSPALVEPNSLENEVLPLVALFALVCSGLVFFLWWVVGQARTICSWSNHGVVAAIALSAWLSQDENQMALAVPLTGYASVALIRIIVGTRKRN